MSTIISVNNLSKRYMLHHERGERYVALRDVLTKSVKSLGRRLANPFVKHVPCSADEEFWALKDVSFEVKDGERVGIIGRNGAGKSTLLKILSSITEPTSGRIVISGRVASLLEVGTGFHPELTGRQNVFLNGAILGMRKAEIQRKFDEIIAFAEVEKFVDTPVKRYSSGMYVRLAFAVAAHLEPEILIIDEVLAVGDINFQKKCLGKMEDVSRSGRTILFVSHNLSAVSALCDRAILIKQGNIAAMGETKEVIDRYLEQQARSETSHVYRAARSSESTAEADLFEVLATDAAGNPKPVLLVDEEFRIKVIWRLNVDVPFLRLGLDIVDQVGNVVLSTMDTDTTNLYGKPRQKGIFREEVTIPKFLLMPGFYTVKIFAGMPRVGRIMEENNVIGFEILENNTHLSHLTAVKRDGFIAMPLNWKVHHEPVQFHP